MKICLRAGAIVTLNARREILHDAALLIEDDRITGIVDGNQLNAELHGEIIDARALTVIPGFVQTHIHLCQTLFRGMADDLELLDWLQKRIFPFEAAHDEHSMRTSALIGIAELVRSGTTTILDMGSVNHEEEVIRAIGETGMRAFTGKAMMDINDRYPKLRESSAASVQSTRSLAERWHNSYEGRLKYAVAPRFVLSCSDGLMKDAHEMLASFDGMLFHTHASENKNEICAVRQRCNMGNVEFLDALGVLDDRACLAHCIHLNENEIGLLASRRVNIAHCPSSNLKLGSGIANVPLLRRRGINVTLGADGAPCNNNLNMFEEMRLASLLQKPAHGPTEMPAQSIVEMATVDGARALGLDKEIGSIEAGKKADLVLLDLNRFWNPIPTSDNMYSSIVYTSGPENVDSVMIDGKWIYRKREFPGIDEDRLMHDAKSELAKLLTRIE